MQPQPQNNTRKNRIARFFVLVSMFNPESIVLELLIVIILKKRRLKTHVVVVVFLLPKINKHYQVRRNTVTQKYKLSTSFSTK